MQLKKCPKCKMEYNRHPALSRVDNKTEICPNCGAAEAIAIMEAYHKNEKLQLRIDGLTEIEKRIKKDLIELEKL